MAFAYDQLLDATIRHLEDLQARGGRHVAVSAETLRALGQPVTAAATSLPRTVRAEIPIALPPTAAPSPKAAPRPAPAMPASNLALPMDAPPTVNKVPASRS